MTLVRTLSHNINKGTSEMAFFNVFCITVFNKPVPNYCK